MDAQAKFAEGFPPGCPPDEAVTPNGFVYRVVQSAEICADDFLTNEEQGTALSAPSCLRRGISVFDSHERAVHRWRISPRLGNAVAEGLLSDSAGKISLPNKKNGHITWWPYDGINRVEFFSPGMPCPL